MRRRIGFAVLALFVGLPACGGSASGGSVEVRTGLGVMDCPSDEWSYSTAEIAQTAEGSATADEALARLSADLGRPSGDPQVESDSPDRVVFLLSDSAGQRLGRVVVGLMPNGWFVITTERCAP